MLLTADIEFFKDKTEDEEVREAPQLQDLAERIEELQEQREADELLLYMDDCDFLENLQWQVYDNGLDEDYDDGYDDYDGGYDDLEGYGSDEYFFMTSG